MDVVLVTYNPICQPDICQGKSLFTTATGSTSCDTTGNQTVLKGHGCVHFLRLSDKKVEGRGFDRGIIN